MSNWTDNNTADGKIGAATIIRMAAEAFKINKPQSGFRTVTSKSTAGAVTYSAAEIMGGLILRDPNGADRADLFPTAAALIAAFYATDTTQGVANVVAGQTIEVSIRNDADAAETITMTTNTGLTLSGAMTIPIGHERRFRIVFTSTTTASIYGDAGTSLASGGLASDGSVAGASGQAQDFGTNGIIADVVQAKTTGSNPTVKDSSGNELMIFTKTASAVNEVTVTNAATGNGPSLAASGETNVPITLKGKGTGAVILGQATSTDVRLAADQPIGDSSGNELIKFAKTASAVNEVTVTNQSTGVAPSITATGGDTNIGLRVGPKGTAVVGAESKISQKGAAASYTTAGATTYTMAQLITGLLIRDPNGAGRSDTTPAATDVVAALPGCKVGDYIEFTIRNSADASETITLVAGSGCTLSGAGQNTTTITIAQNASRLFRLELTNVTAASEAYVLYSLLSGTH